MIRSKQSEPPECLLNRRDLFWRARILFGRSSGRGEAEQLLAVQQPCALGHEAVLARDPFLDFLVGDALVSWLLFPVLMARLVRISSIIFANSHFSFRPSFDTDHCIWRAMPPHRESIVRAT